MLWLTAAAFAQTATFDTLVEGSPALTVVEQGITFSNLDLRLGLGPGMFVIERADGDLTGLAGFTAPNALGFGGWAPGNSAGFGGFGSMDVTPPAVAGSAAIEVFCLGSGPRTLHLYGLRGGVVVASDQVQVPANWIITPLHLEVMAAEIDALRLWVGPKPTDVAYIVVDTVAFVPPGVCVAEVADGVDNDCDGIVDDGTVWYDDDGDGATEDGGDCDDADPARTPGHVEVCDGVDEDCDGQVDEGTSCVDDDGDGLSEDGGDCADADPAVHPGAAEVPGNGRDDDCDGTIDAGLDPDDDGVVTDDCAPADAAVYPGAAELADGLDNDCDGQVDEGTGSGDDDQDGASEAGGDCDDADPAIHPGAAELAGNGRDDDCDGQIDEGAPADTGSPTPTPADADADGWTASEGDCDDRDGWANPEQSEFCDGVDNDCDDLVDEGCAEPAVTQPGGCATSPGSGLLGALAALLTRRRLRACGKS